MADSPKANKSQNFFCPKPNKVVKYNSDKLTNSTLGKMFNRDSNRVISPKSNEVA